jgi:hypothetical protein
VTEGTYTVQPSADVDSPTYGHLEEFASTTRSQ